MKLVASACSRPPLGDSIAVPGRTGPRPGSAWASPGATRGHCEALLGRLWGALSGSRGYRGRSWAIPARCCIDFWYDSDRFSGLLHASESMCCASATTSANTKASIWLARLANGSTSWLDLVMIIRFGFQRLHLDQIGANCIAGRIPKACLQRLGGNIVGGRLPHGSNLVYIYQSEGGGPERTMKSLCAVGGGLGWRKSFSFLSSFLRA